MIGTRTDERTQSAGGTVSWPHGACTLGYRLHTPDGATVFLCVGGAGRVTPTKELGAPCFHGHCESIHEPTNTMF